MHDALSQVIRLLDRLRTNLVAGVDQTRTMLRPRVTGWGTQVLSLQDHEQWRRVWRAALPLLVYAVAFLIAESAAWLLAFAISPKVEASAPLFVQGAVVVSALLLVSPKRWWLYLVLTLPLIVVNAWLFHAVPSWGIVWTLLLLYLAIVSLAVGTAWLVRRFVAVPLQFASARQVSRFVLCVCGGAVLPAFLVTVGRIFIFDWAFWFSWETAYFGYVLAIMVFTPAFVLWARVDVRGVGAMVARGWSGEVMLWVLGLLGVSVAVFGVRYQDHALPPTLIYLLMPLLLWAAVRLGPPGIATALALSTLVAIIGATQGMGPFVGQSTTANVFALQLFLVFVGVPLFFLAALVQEHAQAEAALRASDTRSRAVVRNLPHSAVLLFDADLRHSFADGPGLQTIGLTPVELEGRTVWEAFPADLAAALVPQYEAALAGQTVEADVAHAHYIYRVQVVPVPAAASEALAAPARAGMAVLQDVTEQRRARDELERERTLTGLLSAFSLEFRTLAEHSPDVIARLDPSSRFLYINQPGAALLGLPPEQCMGKTFAEVGMRGDISTPWDEMLWQVVETHTPRTFDAEVHAPGGQVRSLHVRLIPEFAGDGEEGALRSVLGIATDVSALKEAEAHLAAQASELEAIFEAKADGVAVYDLQGRFVRANSALRHLLGFDADAEYTARSLEERAQRLLLFDEQGQPLPPEQWPHWRVLRGEILVGASAMEARVRTVDGRALWISTTGAPVRAADGQVTGIVLITRDVTARRALEQQVAEQAARLEAIFDAMADGILVQDVEGQRIFANDAYRHLLRRHLAMRGYQVELDALFAAPQSEWERHLAITDERGNAIPPDAWATERALRGEILTGESAIDEFMHGADGSVTQVSVSAAPVRNASGQITGAVAVFRDVTARRELERRVAEQAAQLEAIFEAQADGVVVYNLEGRMVRANRTWHAMFQAFAGFNKWDADPAFAALPFAQQVERWHQSVRGQQYPLRDVDGHEIPLEQTPTFRALHGETLMGADAVDERFDGADSHVYVMSVSAAPVRDAAGTIVGAVNVSRDVTAQRQLERQVREQAAQLEAIFEAMADGVFVLDAQGHVTRVNAASHALFGRMPADGRTDTAADTAQARAQAIELRNTDGQPLSLEQLPTQRVLRGEVLAGDAAVTLKVRAYDGRERSISLTGGPLRDAAGQIIGGVGIVRDVTELQRVQAALAEQERLFRTLVEHSPDIIARFDRELRYLYISPAIRQISPVPEADYRGKTNAELGWPEDAYGPAQRAIEQVFQTGQSQTLEESDAAMARYFRAQILPERAADGRVESVLTVTTDITALKRTEQALREANASLEIARQEEERRKQIAESLRGVLAALNSKRPSQEVLQYIVRQAEELLGSAAAVIYGPDHLTDSMPPGARANALAMTLRVRAAEGLRIGGRRPRPQQRLPFIDSAVEQVLASAQPVALVDHSGDPFFGHDATAEADADIAVPCLDGALPAPYHALLVVPIRVHDGLYGCLLLFYSQSHHFVAEEVALAQAYADQVAQAIMNARLQAQLEQEAAAAERNHLARELHDTVKQDLFSASLLAESLPTVWQTHRAEAEVGLRQLHTLTQGALAGLHALLLELRPAALEQSSLSEALRKLGAAMSTRAGVPILVEVEGAAKPEPPLPATVKVAFYRVAQESLMNAAKYAKAHTIRMQLRAKGKRQLDLEIADDGRGFDPVAIPAGHFGLAIMHERAQAVGASMQVRSRAGQGTVVVMSWRSGRKAVAPERAVGAAIAVGENS